MERRTFVKAAMAALPAFAASQGLAAWFHNRERANTVQEFKLRPEQRVLFAQTVGYPARS